MKKKLQVSKYCLTDYLSAGIAWLIFYTLRKIYVESYEFEYRFFYENSVKYWSALFGIPLAWLMLYYSTGYYRNIFKKSRIKEFGQTLSTSLTGNIIIFFVLLLDDPVISYKDYYLSFSLLITSHFLLTWIPRMAITSITKRKILSGKIGFNTLLIGSNGKALNLYNQIKSQDEAYGYKFIGFIDIYDRKNNELCKKLEHLGSFKNLMNIINKYKIEEVILAVESSEHKEIEKILTNLQRTNVVTKVIPSLYDVLTGQVRMSFFLGTPLIIISHSLMPAWQENFKRFFDFTFSLISVILFIPLYLFAIIGIKLTSKGSIFFKQERIGKNGNAFFIYKFRSMYVGSEKHGPQLSSENDNRITKFGRFMRKYRLDEIPQFFNVLKGEMSIVGPRPERQYYINKISEKAPHYYRLLKVKPGITSWGQVKYGYAENVEEMLERLNYDLFYIENMSVYLDFKILIYTIIVVLKRKGI